MTTWVITSLAPGISNRNGKFFTDRWLVGWLGRGLLEPVCLACLGRSKYGTTNCNY